MLAQIAKVEGFHFEDTLTGFKWIGSRSATLSSEGYRNLFGYEEAIGFAVGDVIFDKDGNELGSMPFSIPDRDAMAILRLARQYEVEAFKEGVVEGLRRGKNAAALINHDLEAKLKIALLQNEALADKLKMVLDEGPAEHGNSATH